MEGEPHPKNSLDLHSQGFGPNRSSSKLVRVHEPLGSFIGGLQDLHMDPFHGKTVEETVGAFHRHCENVFASLRENVEVNLLEAY